jgi:hypothetical protein
MALLLLGVSDGMGKDGAVADVGPALDLVGPPRTPRAAQLRHSQGFDNEYEIRSTAKTGIR